MDDERVSTSEMTSVTSSDALQDTEETQDCEVSECYSTERWDTRNEESAQNVLELENVPAICIETSDEDDASERLSIGVERREGNRPQLAEASVDCEGRIDILYSLVLSVLRERARRLRQEMIGLREGLNREMALWKKEMEEFRILREQSDALAFEEATAAARAAAAAYAVESPLSSDIGNIVDVTSEQSIRELAILEYEKNLARYQDSYSFEQAEQRYNAYRRALVDAYKQRLSEVERLCDEELERVRQSASHLQPFKEIASQWTTDENNHGDTNRDCDVRQSTDTEQSKLVEANFDRNAWCTYGKVDHEVNMIPEILSIRFQRVGDMM